MSDIDPEKLEAAIRGYAKLYASVDDGETQIGLVLNAARAHLATLPRFNEVEREHFEVLLADGCCWGVYQTRATAQEWADTNPGAQVVRLTGTAKVKVTP